MQAIRTLRSSARQSSFARDSSDAGVQRPPSATLGWSALVTISHVATLGRRTSVPTEPSPTGSTCRLRTRLKSRPRRRIGIRPRLVAARFGRSVSRLARKSEVLVSEQWHSWATLSGSDSERLCAIQACNPRWWQVRHCSRQPSRWSMARRVFGSQSTFSCTDAYRHAGDECTRIVATLEHSK